MLGLPEYAAQGHCHVGFTPRAHRNAVDLSGAYW